MKSLVILFTTFLSLPALATDNCKKETWQLTLDKPEPRCKQLEIAGRQKASLCTNKPSFIVNDAGKLRFVFDWEDRVLISREDSLDYDNDTIITEEATYDFNTMKFHVSVSTSDLHGKSASTYECNGKISVQ